MPSPTQYLSEQIAALVHQLPGVRDGEADAIHDARVSTRRIREALPIVTAAVPNADFEPVRVTARKAGRALGRARDLDVALELVTELERRAPDLMGSLSALRSDLLREQTLARRRLVKTIDALPFDEVRAIGRRLAVRHWWTRPAAGRGSGTRSELRRTIVEHAAALRASIAHGSGIYFPKRAHATRIDLKRLRYGLEMSELPRAGAGRAVKLLTKTQNVLGKLHDIDGLRERLSRTQESESENASRHRSLTALLDAESAALHARFLRRRRKLLELCSELERPTGSGWQHVGGALAGAGALAATAWLLADRPTLEAPALGLVRRAR